MVTARAVNSPEKQATVTKTQSEHYFKYKSGFTKTKVHHETKNYSLVQRGDSDVSVTDQIHPTFTSNINEVNGGVY